MYPKYGGWQTAQKHSTCPPPLLPCPLRGMVEACVPIEQSTLTSSAQALSHLRPQAWVSGPCHPPAPMPCLLSSHEVDLDWLQSSAHRASLWHPDHPDAPGSPRKALALEPRPVGPLIPACCVALGKWRMPLSFHICTWKMG